MLLDMESGAALPLGLLHSNPILRHPVSPDLWVSGSHNCDVSPTLDMPSCPGVGLPPLFVEADYQDLQRGLQFCDQNSVGRYYGRFKVEPLLHT